MERNETGQAEANLSRPDQTGQAAEKALKAPLVSKGVNPPGTHSIARLMEELEDAGIDIPASIRDAVILTDYAVITRYPGDYERVTA